MMLKSLSDFYIYLSIDSELGREEINQFQSLLKCNLKVEVKTVWNKLKKTTRLRKN